MILAKFTWIWEEIFFYQAPAAWATMNLILPHAEQITKRKNDEQSGTQTLYAHGSDLLLISRKSIAKSIFAHVAIRISLKFFAL